jgi:class 3 adenylate cyclase
MELEVGIGAGQVAVGECGHRTLRQRDVFGEEVNRTARIGHYRSVAITGRVYSRRSLRPGRCVQDRMLIH